MPSGQYLCVLKAPQSLKPSADWGKHSLSKHKYTCRCYKYDMLEFPFVFHSGLELIQKLITSSNEHKSTAKAALNKLVSSNLSAKYWISGRLSQNDVITDMEFFDAGLVCVCVCVCVREREREGENAFICVLQ